MARDGLRTTEASSAQSPFGTLRRVLDLDAFRPQLRPNRVGGLEILGLTGLGSGSDAFGDPTLQIPVRLSRRGENVEYTHRELGQRPKGCGAPAGTLVQFPVRRTNEIEQLRNRLGRVQIVVECLGNIDAQLTG